jgi:hypothetical protein
MRPLCFPKINIPIMVNDSKVKSITNSNQAKKSTKYDFQFISEYVSK